MVQQAALTIIGVAGTLLCFLGGSSLGPMGAMLNVLTPLPISYLCMRFGLRTGVTATSLTVLALSFMLPLPTLLTYAALFGCSALLLPTMLLRRFSWERAVALTVCCVVALALVLVGSYVVVSGQAPATLIDHYLQNEIDTAMQVYQGADLDQQQLQQMEEVARQVADFIRDTFVGLYIAGVLAVQLLTLLLLQRLRKDHYQIEGVPFPALRLPAVLIWVLILVGFSLLIPQESIQLVARNGLAVLLPLYFMQGLAVVADFLQKRAYPAALKGMIYVMVFLFNPLPLIVTGVGVFDLWVDFRRPRQKK